MEARDLGIKYRATYHELLLIVNNIKDIGFNVDKYSQMLEDINTDISDKIKNCCLNDLEDEKYNEVYSGGIIKLLEIKKNLDVYDVYFKVLNSCRWLNIKINDEEEMDSYVLDKYVSEMIENLKIIAKSSTINYEHEKCIIDKVYEMAYEIIKLELLFKGDSRLYEYAKGDSINATYFSIVIKNDIARLGIEKDYNIEERIYEINKNGIGSNYFDLELIKRILLNDNHDNIRGTINDNVLKLVDDIEENDKTLIHEVRNLNLLTNKREEIINRLKKNKQKFRRNIISIGLAFTLIGSGGLGIEELVRHVSYRDEYNETTEIYSSIDGKKKKQEKKSWITNPQDSLKAIVYNKNNEGLIYRDCLEYDLSQLNINYENIEDYYKYGIENYGVIPVKHKTVSGKLNYLDSYTEVVLKKYEYMGKEENWNSYFGGLLFLYFQYIILLFGIEKKLNDKSLLSKIGKIKEYSTLIDEDNNDYYAILKKINNLMDEVLNTINNNQELREDFYKLYNNNRYLLDNPEELFEKVDDAKYYEALDGVKKLIKAK